MVGDYPATTRKLTARFWLLAGAALVAATVTLKLGLWQMSRAAEKLSLQQAIEDRAVLPPIDNHALAGITLSVAEPTYRRVMLQGHWLDRYTVYLENRQMSGKPGFFVLTPLQLDGSRHVVVVQRGWVQRNFRDRTALPALAKADGMVHVVGRIAPPPAKLYEFSPQAQGNIRQNLDLAGFIQETGLPLAPFTVLQSGPADDGLSREWDPVDAGVAKHHGYAFQWFALSGLIVFLFVWFQIVRRFFITR